MTTDQNGKEKFFSFGYCTNYRKRHFLIGSNKNPSNSKKIIYAIKSHNTR
jgi:hypothetical protein